jgi:predicted 3-demethylubiquinone-9 3-methyltransferase (glyoxalase superfamily)
MQKITPFLWFDGEAEEAMNFYTSIFKNSKCLSVTRYGDAGPGPKGSVMVAAFELDGQEFVALNGGPQYTFSPAISFVVNCENQQEIDEMWEKLSDGGTNLQCGWLQDRYGVTWQIVPHNIVKLVNSATPEKSNRVMAALMQMEKIDVAKLEEAYAQG